MEWNGKQLIINGKRIGNMTSDGMFIMHKKAIGKFRLYDGWGLGQHIITDLCRRECRGIQMLVEGDDGKLSYTLYVSPQKWLQRGLVYHNPKLHEKQLILPETSFDKKVMATLEV